MAYCRWGEESDVYAFSDGRHFNVFYGHPEKGPFQEKIVRTLAEFRKVMMDLRQQGYQIPEHTFQRIDREIMEFRSTKK